MSEGQQLVFGGFGLSLSEKTELAVQLLRVWQPMALELDPELGYWGCDSGGKDSGVIRRLAVLAGVKVEWHYNVTTIDPSEVCKFIRKEHPDTVFIHPPASFFHVLAEDRGFPLRQRRWCCQVFKECSGLGKVKITGVRWEESPRRFKTWKMFQRFDAGRSHGDPATSTFMCNPLIYWTAADVWEFTRKEGLAYCCLYDEGFKRIGCVGCPMRGAEGIAKDFERWPAIARGWARAFERLWERKRGTAMVRGKYKGKPWPGIEGVDTWQRLFEWWKAGKGSQGRTEGCQLGLW